jgi:cell division protein FtsQ
MWDDARQLDTVALVLTLIALVALAWGAVSWVVRQPAFEFREVVVHGPLERASGAHLEAVIRDELAGTFFTMNLDRARASLAKVPWVRKVALRRQWPQRLDVTVEEHTPFARWNDTGLVNAQGEVFAADYDGELPGFAGPEGSATAVMARYREWGEMLRPLGLALRDVSQSPRGGWQLRTVSDGGVLTIALGRDEPAARLERFVAAYGRTIGALARAGTRIEYVDMRYRNGFAARVPGFKERPARKAA